MLILFLAAAAADKLPPANPLPLVDTEEAAVMAPVTALVDALNRSDGAAVRAVTVAEGSATETALDPNGSAKVTPWPAFAAALKPGPERVEEVLGQPAIELDGGAAMVWAPYTGRTNGRVTQCGYDHFDLVRVGGAWKVLHLTWSQKKNGCGPDGG